MAMLWKKSVYKERELNTRTEKKPRDHMEKLRREQVMCSFLPDLHVTFYRRGLF